MHARTCTPLEPSDPQCTQPTPAQARRDGPAPARHPRAAVLPPLPPPARAGGALRPGLSALQGRLCAVRRRDPTLCVCVGLRVRVGTPGGRRVLAPPCSKPAWPRSQSVDPHTSNTHATHATAPRPASSRRAAATSPGGTSSCAAPCCAATATAAAASPRRRTTVRFVLGWGWGCCPVPSTRPTHPVLTSLCSTTSQPRRRRSLRRGGGDRPLPRHRHWLPRVLAARQDAVALLHRRLLRPPPLLRPRRRDGRGGAPPAAAEIDLVANCGEGRPQGA